jgi:hypothetical protein
VSAPAASVAPGTYSSACRSPSRRRRPARRSTTRSTAAARARPPSFTMARHRVAEPDDPGGRPAVGICGQRRFLLCYVIQAGGGSDSGSGGGGASFDAPQTP